MSLNYCKKSNNVKLNIELLVKLDEFLSDLSALFTSNCISAVEVFVVVKN